MRLRQIPLCQVRHISASVRQPWWSRRLFAFLLASLVSLFAATSALAQFVASAPAPTNLSAAPSTGQVALSWIATNANFPAPPPHPPLDGGPSYSTYYYYYIYRSTTPGGEGSTPLYKVPQATAQPNGASTATYTDTSTVNGTTYYYQVTAVTISAVSGTDPTTTGGSESARSNEASATPLVRINCGGADYTDGAGKVWNADQGFTGGNTITTTTVITGTTDPTLYQAQRSGAQFSYAEPVANGTYVLILLFAEIQGNTTGQRTFNVTANGTQILTNYDIYQNIGAANTAVVKGFPVPVTVTNGQFTLSLAGVTGNAALAAFALLTPRPVGDVPPPGWAMDAVPTDSGSEAGGAGPGSSMQVSLPSGVEENMPGPDLSAYNPVGPSVSYERMYRSKLAARGYGSPGLSPGWVDNYDLRVLPSSASYKLLYPNGAAESWIGTTGSLTTPYGAPYLANAPATGTLTMTMKDRSVYTFTQVSTASVNYAAGTYLLAKMTNLVGHSITLSRDTAANNYRVLSITNDAASPVMLLKFNYGGAVLSSVEDLASSAASEHRQVGYAFTGGSLSNVTQVAADGATANDLWRYGYQTINNEPFLNSVSTPDPSDATGAAYTSATVTYDPTGFVTAHTDANNRLRTFGFGPSGVQLQVFNHAGDTSPVQQWMQKFGINNVDMGFVDAANYTANVSYAGTPSPYLPGAVTNRNRQKTSITYDPANNYGNVTSTTDPRGVQVNMTYQYPSDFALGQLATTQTVNGSSSLAGTSFTYYAPVDGVINGLLKTMTAPQPGASSSAATVITTYQYDALGNVTQMTTPGPNGITTVTYNYTTGYNGTTQPEALGEPLSVTVSGPAAGSTGTTTTVTYQQYDGRGNCTATIDCLGNRTDFQFNLADQPLSVLLPATGQTGAGRSHMDMAYQYVGGPMNTASLYDEGNTSSPVRQTINAYGHEGELLKVSDLKGPVMAYQYDGRYRRIAVQDGQNIQNGQGSSTYYQFDPVGNLYQVLYPLSTSTGVGTFDTESYTYDADSNMLTRTDGNNATTTYIRDTTVDSRLMGITYPASSNTSNVSFGYDTFERLSSLGNGEVAKTYTYDDIDDLRTAAVSFTNGPQNQTLTYDYNPDGSRSLMTFTLPVGPNQNQYNYQYDGLGQLTQAGFPWTDGNASYTYVANRTTGYVRMGWLKMATTPRGKTSYGYNARGQMTSLLNQWSNAGGYTLSSSYSSVAYDAPGNKTSEAAYIPQVGSAPDISHKLAYIYSSRDELTGEQSAASGSGVGGSSAYSNAFGYDLSYNPTTFKGSAVTTNIDNQFTLSGFAYDGNGNPTTYTGNNLTFDIENRLLSIASLGFAATYAPDNRRASKTAAGQTTYYVYDEDGSPSPLIEERMSGGTPTVSMGWGMGADGLRARYSPTTGGPYYLFEYDPQGSLVQRQTGGNTSYPALDTAMYDAYGSRLNDVDAFTGGAEPVRDAVGFQGQFGAYTDNETGLVLMGHRYYSPGTGRFLTRDPKGYGGGINLYGFTGNNPVNEMDPEGTDWLDIASNFSAGAGDIISGGLTQKFRRHFGYDDIVDKGSGSYHGGQVAGVGYLAVDSVVSGVGVINGVRAIRAAGGVRAAITAVRGIGAIDALAQTYKIGSPSSLKGVLTFNRAAYNDFIASGGKFQVMRDVAIDGGRVLGRYSAKINVIQIGKGANLSTVTEELVHFRQAQKLGVIGRGFDISRRAEIESDAGQTMRGLGFVPK